jgi:hypothetical protein
VSAEAVIRYFVEHLAVYRNSSIGEVFHAGYRTAVANRQLPPVEGRKDAANAVVTHALARMNQNDVAQAVAGSNLVTENVVTSHEGFTALEPMLMRLNMNGQGRDLFVVRTGKEGQDLAAFIKAEMARMGLGNIPFDFEFVALPVNETDPALLGTTLESAMAKHLEGWKVDPKQAKLLLNLPEDLRWINNLPDDSFLKGAIMALYSALSYGAFPLKDIDGMQKMIEFVVAFA